MTKTELKDFLDAKVILYNQPEFIETDPIQIPHTFTTKEDIEIAGFLTATISWGNRKSILKNASSLMQRLDESPYDFIMNHSEDDLNSLNGFVHRTFNENDLKYFIKALRNIYKKHNGLETVFSKHQDETSLQNAIHKFKAVFFELPHEIRTEKHVSDPHKNSAAKRINILNCA